MKKTFIRNLFMLSIATATILFFGTPVKAEWKKDINNNWLWTENKMNAVGWKYINGSWYHFNNSGIMDVNWINDGGKWYHLSSNGSMDKGFIKSSYGYIYYLDESGQMVIGWINYNNKWYYAQSDGSIATSSLEINGTKYNFSSDGQLIDSKTTSNDETENSESSTSTPRKAYVATSSNPLNVRSEASVSSNIVGMLPKGAEILVSGSEVNGFLNIKYNNNIIGWASSSWISFDKPTTTDNDGVNNDYSSEENNQSVDSSLKTIRQVPPEVGNPFYYSNDNIFYKVRLSPPFTSGGNCTWYAYGRIYELTGKKQIDAGFTGNAYEWWDANKRSGKYRYGSTPKVGAIAVWKSSLPGSGGSGHVAVVEKIENGKVYISDSMWHGGIFKYSQIYSTEYLDGYIYTDEANY